LNNETIDRILNRAEERTLSEADKTRLRDVIDKLKSPQSSNVQPVDRYIAHFFSKLINVDKALSEREQLSVRFTEVCNKYLTGKRMVYDDKGSKLGVKLVPADRDLPLKALSSGEKQIVSLFSHLYLRERGKALVIIDEPELSLSVTWQQQLLPDILETGKCSFLAAVTHSPFIFDNSLDSYAVNLSDCISETTA
jgi:predicted ATP-binding protein involved in virulence